MYPGRRHWAAAPVWAVVAMAASAAGLFIDSIGVRPRLILDAIGSVGRATSGVGGDVHGS